MLFPNANAQSLLSQHKNYTETFESSNNLLYSVLNRDQLVKRLGMLAIVYAGLLAYDETVWRDGM